MKHLVYSLVALLATFTSAALGADDMTAEHLTTNGRTNPLGIAADELSFSWSLRSDARGAAQSGYRIRVGRSEEAADVWDSGRVRSDQQVDIRLPDGVKLAPATRYFWQVKPWDQEGEEGPWSKAAWFETGLLSKDDWRDARWISRPTVAPDLARWSDYRLAVEFTLESEALGVFLRTSEDGGSGLMWQINVTGASPVLKLHRRINGTYEVLDSVDLAPLGYSNVGLLEGKHILEFELTGSRVATTLDSKAIDTRTTDVPRRGFVGFRTHGRERAKLHRVKVTSLGDRAVLLTRDHGDVGSEISGETDRVLTGPDRSLPLFRTSFEADDDLVSARLYASALGLYELSCNGSKVGDQFLAPGWTDYPQRLQHQTYDITSQIRKGPNVVATALADGWYRGKVGLGWRGVYGDRLAFTARIKLTYGDGRTQWIDTDASWRTADGPFLAADLQDGENYDVSREARGWNTQGFDASDWQAVEIIDAPPGRLVPQPDEPIRAIATLTATRRTEPVAGHFLYDLGQNMVGVARITMRGRKGQTAVIRYAEELYRTGDRQGHPYTDNFRSAKVTDRYRFAEDGTVTYQPTFTQHGFRYIEISGLDQPPAPDQVQGVVLGSDLPDTGELVTSNAMLNQLVSNVRWGQRGNFLSIPTDTPARDERLGWTGDINVFAPAACRLQDTRAFLSKWMDDVRDSQRPDGNIPAVVPQPGDHFGETGVGWSDAFITIPHAVWRATGDARIIHRNWDAMQRYYDFVHRSATHDGDLLEQGRSSWFSGDWLSLEEGWDRLDEHKVIATAYFAENTRMMAEMAAAMGDEAKSREWHALHPKIREAFTEAYCAEDGSVHTGTQTAYALALGMEMIADPVLRQRVGEKFVETLAGDDHHLRTGFLGTPWLLPALSSIGRDDLAMRLLLNEDYPSWGFPISLGATTMWERWNSIRADGEFGPVEMNSFNHYAYGAVADWMFRKIGGLEILEPGYRKVRIEPLIGKRLKIDPLPRCGLTRHAVGDA